MDNLIERLKARIADPDKIIFMIDHVRNTKRIFGKKASQFEAPIFPPVMLESINKAEEELEFSLPPLLREIYMKVANGGFGPGYGMLGLEDGGTDDLGGNLLSSYPFCIDVHGENNHSSKTFDGNGEEQENDFEVLEGFLPICYYGCTVYALLDARVEDGEVFGWDAGQFAEEPLARSLRLWLEDWLAS